MGRRQSRGTRAVAAALIVLGALAVNDVIAAPGRSLAARAAIVAIDEYRVHVSPRIAGVVKCRFTPTCSAYGRIAIRRYGFLRGGAKTAARIARCGPWTKAGTVDLP